MLLDPCLQQAAVLQQTLQHGETRAGLLLAGEKFAADFADAFAKLLELGVPFPEEEPVGQYVAAPGERPKGETSHATH